MKRIALILTLALVVAACGDDDSGGTTATTTAPTTQATTTAAATTEAPTTTAAPTTQATTTAAPTTAPPTTEPAGPAEFVISTVGFGAGPMVVITNTGGESGSLAGHWLCQRPSYFELPDVEVGPGQSFALSLGGDVFLPPPGAITAEVQGNIGAIRAEGGEIGLYEGNSFGSADAIRSYVEWGSAGHGRSGTAIEAGIWDEGGFVETTGDTPSISRSDFETIGSTAWVASS